MGSRGDQARGFAQGEVTVRHLSHADHGGRRDPDDPPEFSIPGAFPHRGRARRHEIETPGIEPRPVARRWSISDFRATWRTSSCPPGKIPSSRSKTPHGFATCKGNMKNSTLPSRILPGLILLSVAAATLPVLAKPKPIQSPEVHPDRSVTFRLRAPNAKEVTLDLEGAKGTPMQKDGEGVWSATTGPLEPHFYGYSFSVDGVSCAILESRGHTQPPLRRNCTASGIAPVGSQRCPAWRLHPLLQIWRGGRQSRLLRLHSAGLRSHVEDALSVLCCCTASAMMRADGPPSAAQM